jgi:hypothetical protein
MRLHLLQADVARAMKTALASPPWNDLYPYPPHLGPASLRAGIRTPLAIVTAFTEYLHAIIARVQPGVNILERFATAFLHVEAPYLPPIPPQEVH